MIRSYIWTTLLFIISLQEMLTEENISNNCKTNVRGKHFIIAFPDNLGTLKSTTQLHAFIVSFNDRITEVKITSQYLLTSNTHFTKTVMVQPWSFERVIIPKELEIIGTEKSLKSIELKSDFEISVYSIHMETHSTDGYLAIPTDNFGTQYVVASYRSDSFDRGGTVTIIGSQDDTSATIQLASEITYENKQYLRGDILNFNVSSSEVIQIFSRGNDLTGSVIISENPIGVISGESCANTPDSACDVLLEQSIPVSSWGTRHFYSTTGIQSGTSRYRMVAFFNDTSFNVNNNNIILGYGEFSEFDLVGNGLIVTSKPASLIQILVQIDGSTVDPSIIQVPTEDQFALFLGFTTPTHSGADVDGFINFVNIIVKSNERASLRLNGDDIINTNAAFLPYLVSENKITDSDYDLLVVQLPRKEGLYYITQDLDDYSPMSAIVYGYEISESYGYAAGLSLPSNQRLLTIFPFYTRLLGGDELNIRPPCRPNTSGFFTIMCQFGDSTLMGKSSREDITCVTPPLLEVGFMTIHASIDNGRSFPYNGLIYVADENSLTPHISQLEEDIVLDITANKNEVLKWDPNIFGKSNKLSLGIQFINDSSSNSIEWSSMTLIDEMENSGEIRFNMSEIASGQQLEELPTSAGTYVIKIVKGEQDKFITTKMKIIKNNDSRLQACSSAALVMNQPKDLLPCPCTTAQARSDANFIEDEHTTLINYFHPGSDTCFRSSQTASGSGQQCCYKDGNINTDKLGAGTADSFSSDKSPPKHFQNDLLPWLPCCKFSNDCDVYLQYRPSDDCKDYIPPIPARTNGDPHFLTLDGLEYTFNGAGEFLLISSPLNNFTFQARMEIFQNTPASVYTAFVIRTGNSSKIQIERNNQNQILLHIEDQMLEIKEGILLNLIARESKIQITNDYSQVVVSFSHGVSLRVYIYATSMSFLLQLGDQYRNNVSGLMGNFNSDPSDDFMLPNGVIISQNSPLRDIHYNFGLHWMVNEVESIFTYQSPFDHSSYSKPNFTPLFEIPELENIDPEVRELCGSSFSCLYDATTTGMLSFANDTMQFNIIFEDVVNNSESIVSCGRPDSVENGGIVGSVFFVGNQVNVICNSGYQLNGSAELVCTENGEWFPVTSSCAETMPLGPGNLILIIFIAIFTITTYMPDFIFSIYSKTFLKPAYIPYIAIFYYR